MNAEKLIKRVAENDRDAFEKFYNNYFKLVMSVAWSIMQNKSDAEDVATEVFITVWRKAGTFSGGNGKSWLCAIAKNTALTMLSRKRRETATEEIEETAVSYRIENGCDDKMLVEYALSILSDKERETVLLYNSGYKHKEIAEITEEKLGTITWRYNTALKKMRDFLEEKR